MADVSDPNVVSSLPAWVQAFINGIVVLGLAAGGFFTYWRQRNKGAVGDAITVSGGEDHGMVNQFIVKALDIMDRSASAHETSAAALQAVAQSMLKRDTDAEIERRAREMAERMFGDKMASARKPSTT